MNFRGCIKYHYVGENRSTHPHTEKNTITKQNTENSHIKRQTQAVESIITRQCEFKANKQNHSSVEENQDCGAL